jgi:hypothetical protein
VNICQDGSERRPDRVRVGVSTCDSRERSHLPLPLLAIESAHLTVDRKPRASDRKVARHSRSAWANAT